MNYKNFRFNAVIDWIELEIETVNPTNFQTIKRHIIQPGKKPYVKAIDQAAGGAASQFRFKIQDPKNWQHVAAILNGINDDTPLVAEATIVKSIEVSFDAYSNTANRDELVRLTELFYRYLTNPVSLKRRFSGRKGFKKDVEAIDSTFVLRRLLDKGRNICIGNNEDDSTGFKKYKTDDEYMQIYCKTTDNNGIPISSSDYRARIEIRLKGGALPCTNLNSWREYKFESLSRYFNFRTMNNRVLALAPKEFLKAFDSITQLSSIGGYKRRKHPLITSPDIELNNHVYEALRCLSDRMLSKRGI